MNNLNLKKDKSTRRVFFNLQEEAPIYNYLTKSKNIDHCSCKSNNGKDKLIPKL